MLKSALLAALIFVGAVVTNLSPAYAGGGSCEPALVPSYLQSRPYGQYCEGYAPRPRFYQRRVFRHWSPPRYVYRAPPVYVAPPPRVVATPCCVTPPPPCNTCGNVALAAPPVVHDVCRPGYRLVPGPGVYGVLCVPN